MSDHRRRGTEHWRKLPAASLILLVILQAPPASAEGGSACKAKCDEYKAAKATCDANPGVRTGDVDCTPSAFNSKWGQLKEQCAAIEAAKDSSSANMAMAVVYTAVAAGCGAACAFSWTGAATAACVVAVGAAGVMDLGYSMAVGKAAQGLAGGLVGAYYGTSIAVTVGKDIGNLFSGDYGTRQNACVSAGVSGVVAGLKWYSMTSFKDTADKACQAIQALGSSVTPGAGTGGGPASGRPGATGGSAPSQGEANYTEAQAQKAAEILQAPSSAATEGLLSKMPNKANIPDLLSQTGLSLKDIAKSLESQPPSSVLGSMQGMPATFGDALRQVDEEIKGGRLEAAGTDGTYSSAGGGAGGGAKPSGGGVNPFAGLDFGGAKPEAAAAAGTVDFGINRAPGADGDIWHTGYKGTIFQIVSGKIGQNHHRVEKVEWATPLNRALMGLPALPKP